MKKYFLCIIFVFFASILSANDIKQIVKGDVVDSFFYACKTRDTQMIDILFQTKLGVDSYLYTKEFRYSSKRGSDIIYTPLEYAILTNNLPVALLILDKSPNINRQCIEYELEEPHGIVSCYATLDPLLSAIEKENFKLVNRLIKSLPNYSQKDRARLIKTAFFGYKDDITNFLIKHGLSLKEIPAEENLAFFIFLYRFEKIDSYRDLNLNFSQIDQYGFSLFSYLSSYNSTDHEQFKKEMNFVFKRCDTMLLNVKNKMGKAPIHLAAGIMINELITKELLTKMLAEDAIINIQDNDGLTPLMFSVIGCRPIIVEFLLKNGANPYITNTRDISALIYACQPRKNYTHSIKKREKILELLIKYQNETILIKDKHFWDLLYDRLTNPPQLKYLKYDYF